MSKKPENIKKEDAKNLEAASKKTSTKKTNIPDEDALDDEALMDEEQLPVKSSGKSKAPSKKSKADSEDDEDDDIEDVEDDWEKSDEDENWDPDFDEFDIPKTTTKKAGKTGKPVKDDELGLDDDFKEFGLFDDLDNAGTGYDDEEDDY